MIGTTVKQYKILERIGAGGMGVVYKAEDTRLGRTVALKFLPPYALDSEEDRTRFLIEAQSAAALDHPNICTIHEIGDAQQHQFIVMAYVSGPSLKERLKDGALDPAEAVNIATQISSGLSKAHEKGIIHRDIKPANILLAEGGLVKVCDFGLAKSSISKKVTRTGSTIGTAAYMSPEQARSETVDQRTDIWSLGVILYEMLAGKPPFVADHEAVVIYAILNDDYPRLEEKRPGLPAALYEIVRKALAHKSSDRYATMEEMRRDLKAVASQIKEPSTLSGGFPVVQPASPARASASVRDTTTTQLTPPNAAPKKPEPTEKKKSSPVLYIAIGVLTAAAVLAVMWFNREPKVEGPPEETTALTQPDIAPPEAAGDAATATKSTGPAAAGEKLPVVAVLYMDNLSGNRADDYFAAGMTEDIIYELSNLKKIKVRSRFDVMPLKGQDFSVTDMGKRLGADYLIEGAVRLEKRQLRMTAHLHRVSDQDLVWSLRYDRPASDVFAVQAEIADSIARALAIAITPEEKGMIAKAPTSNAEAYDHYLRGRHSFERRSEEDNEQAEKSFRKAISLDKDFAAAHIGLARTLLQRPDWGWDTDPKLLVEADAELQRAKRDSSSAEYLAASGLLLSLRNDPQGAIRLGKRVAQSVPDDPEAHYLLGVEFAKAAQPDDATRELQRALELKPDHAHAHRWLGRVSSWSGKPAEAEKHYQRAVQLEPDAVTILAEYGSFRIRRGEFAAADSILRRAIALRPKTYGLKVTAGRSAILQGRTEEAVKMLDVAADKSPDFNSYLWLGQAQRLSGKKPAAEKSWREAYKLIGVQLAQAPDDPGMLYGQLYLRALLGEVKNPDPEFKKLATNTKKTADPTVRYYWMAVIDAHLGNTDRALENIERILKMNVWAPEYIAADPALENLKGDTRFQALTGVRNKPSS